MFKIHIKVLFIYRRIKMLTIFAVKRKQKSIYCRYLALFPKFSYNYLMEGETTSKRYVSKDDLHRGK